MGDPRWSSLFLKDCTPWEGPTLEQLVEDCLPWEGPHAGAGQERQEDGAAETTCRKPHSPSPCAAQAEEVENSGGKLSLGRREGWGEGVYRFVLLSHYPTSLLIGNKII